jgi:hypothetical protein
VKVRALVARWSEYLAAFDAKIAEHDALPAAAPDEARFDPLHRADRFISTSYTPLPPTPAALKAALLVERAAFVARLNQFGADVATVKVKLSDLIADLSALLPVTEFDSDPFVITAEENAVIALRAPSPRPCISSPRRWRTAAAPPATSLRPATPPLSRMLGSRRCRTRRRRCSAPISTSCPSSR